MILSLEPSRLFQIHFPPTLPLALSLGETALCRWCMGQLTKANLWWCHCKATLGGPVCWFSLCREGGVKGKKEWRREGQNSMQQPKYLQHSSLTEERLCLNMLTRLVSILDKKKKNRDTQGRSLMSTDDNGLTVKHTANASITCLLANEPYFPVQAYVHFLQSSSSYRSLTLFDPWVFHHKGNDCSGPGQGQCMFVISRSNGGGGWGV